MIQLQQASTAAGSSKRLSRAQPHESLTREEDRQGLTVAVEDEVLPDQLVDDEVLVGHRRRLVASLVALIEGERQG